MATLEVSTYPVSDSVQGLILQGEIDLHTCPKVRESVNRLIRDHHTNLLINLEQTRYIDSTGLVVLLHALKRVQEKDGKLAVVCTDAHILKIFTISGLVHSFRIYPSEQEALSLFKSEAAEPTAPGS